MMSYKGKSIIGYHKFRSLQKYFCNDLNLSQFITTKANLFVRGFAFIKHPVGALLL